MSSIVQCRVIGVGVQIDDAGADPRAAVALAAQADHLGCDVALMASSEEAPADTLTLATWAAVGTTSTLLGAAIRTTDRPASMVGRAATSLQLLSSGRAALVLDAASGVDELREAVGVLRAMENSGAPRVSQSGAHHRLDGAEPSPAVDRPVPLWISGSSTEIVTVAGQLADGWVVDVDRIGLDTYASLNRALDAAAVAAGRDPREVKRVVTFDVEDDPDGWVGAVAELGVTTFVLRVDAKVEEARLRSFFEDVVPRIREIAERALPQAYSGPPLRRADVRAKRRPGIGYDEVPADLADRAVEPGDSAFAKVRSTYMRGGDPGLVLRPGTSDEVRSAIDFAHKHTHLPLGVRSGGHGISGRSTNDGGLVIDVGALNEISVLDEASRLVRIGPGARWRNVATALQPHGWALSSGDYGGVGVGGLATTGGIGFLNRNHGLTIDSLRAVEMVLADGRLVRASATENPELFWAARGAGANYGIAVAFEFEANEVDDVGWAQLAFRAPDPAAYLEAFGAVAAAAPRETTPFLIVGQGMAQMMAMVDSADPDVIVNQLQPFAEIAPMVQQQVVIAPYAAVMNMFPDAPHNGRGEPVSRSVFARDITAGFASASADLINSGASHWYQIRTLGGAVRDIPPDATAYAHRDATFSLTVMGANAQRVDKWFDPIRRESDGLYLSFESDLDPARISDAFPPATLARLRALKAEIDPRNLFKDNFNVAPAGDPGTGTSRSTR